MIKFKHLAHPLRTAGLIKIRLKAHLDFRRFAAHSKRRFQNDPRYDLRNVNAGFKPRRGDSSGDDRILRRICDAYIRAVADQRSAPACYGPTEWWSQIRHSCLHPVIRALQDRDYPALRDMYGNFFRDRCSTGLVGVPFGMWDAYLNRPLTDLCRHAYLGDLLYSLDYWAAQTHERFELRDLAGPVVGNPFGAVINGTLISTRAEYQHYCAHRMIEFLGSGRFVAEIGGGYGGAAYYLLRDARKVTYIDFDVPETIALASYYLQRAFPHLKFLLYGEQTLTPHAISNYDVILLPLFEIARIPAASIDLVFASHSISDLAEDAIPEYLDNIARMTSGCLFYIGHKRGAEAITLHGNVAVKSHPSGWHGHKAPDAEEVECLIRFRN